MTDALIDPGFDATYEATARDEMEAWKRHVLRGPGVWDRATRGVQDRINTAIPEKVHAVVTRAIEQMTQGILTGSGWTSARPLSFASLQAREARVRDQIGFYRTTASVEGGVAGAGGFLLAAADFPVLMGLKVKMLFEIAALYGHNGSDWRERLYILHVFQLAFSSARHRPEVLARLEDWIAGVNQPASLDEFDWRKFQLEYRDYIDLAKLAQLIPVIGAPVGAVVNYRLVDHLGRTGMNAWRMRAPELALPIALDSVS